MKKRGIIFIGAVILLLVCVCACSWPLSNSLANIDDTKGGDTMNFEITDMMMSITKNIFDMGCVRNEKDADAIARIIFTSVYGNDFDRGLPLLVQFDDEEQVWKIETQLPEDSLGGSVHMIIKKSNAEVVAIWGTK